MKNWLIKKLGGHTREEYLANRDGYNRAVRKMLSAKRATIMDSTGPLTNAKISGALIVAPDSNAVIMGCYVESQLERARNLNGPSCVLFPRTTIAG